MNIYDTHLERLLAHGFHCSAVREQTHCGQRHHLARHQRLCHAYIHTQGRVAHTLESTRNLQCDEKYCSSVVYMKSSCEQNHHKDAHYLQRGAQKQHNMCACLPAASSASTPNTLTSGRMAFTYAATPASMPPPPQHTKILSMSLPCRAYL